LKAKILEKLDHPEHVRSERVSKWFKRVGLDMSWHDVTVLIDSRHSDFETKENGELKMKRKDFGPYGKYSLTMV
jgi:hypothetical protein